MPDIDKQRLVSDITKICLDLENIRDLTASTSKAHLHKRIEQLEQIVFLVQRTIQRHS